MGDGEAIGLRTRSPGAARSRGAAVRSDRRVPAFFVLLVALSAPLWIAGEVVSGELMPGLPVGALAFLCPVVAASLLIHRRKGWAGVAALLGRAFDVGRITNRAWFLPILLLMPAVFLVSYAVMVALDRPLPEPQIDLTAVPVLLAVLFLAGLAEELGFMGYAIDPMQDRWGALRAALLLGAFWAVWHWIPLAQGARGVGWIAGWSVYTVALRVLHVWIYDNTGRSLFGQALFHATSNVSWQLFPNDGSHFDPAVTAPIVVIVAVVVAVLWRPRGNSGGGRTDDLPRR